jgi:hypothetical protein
MAGDFVLRFSSPISRSRVVSSTLPPTYRGRAPAQRRMGVAPRGAPYSAAAGDHLGPGLWPSTPLPVPASLGLRALAATAPLPAARRSHPMPR